MLVLAHLSDIHLGPLPPAAIYHFLGKRFLGYVNWRWRRHVHRPEVLEAIISDLHLQSPDHIAVTGDLVNLALPAEFARAREWLKTLGPPEKVSVVPGNHDAYVRFRRAPGYELWSDYMSSNAAGRKFLPDDAGGFPFVRLLGDIALVGVCTARPNFPTVAAGQLGGRQLAAVASVLSRLHGANVARVLLIHHPPLPGMTSWRRGLHDAGELKRVLEEEGAELVLHGHDHRQSLKWVEWRDGAIPVVGVPSASAAAPLTKPMSPSAKPPGRYNLFRLGRAAKGWRIEMTGRGLTGDGGQVTQIENLVLLPAGGTAGEGLVSATGP